FGSPRVGTVAFRDAFRIPAYRLVNNADVVSQLPPFPYRHVGERIVFDETGRAHRAPPAGQRWLAQIRGLRRGLEEAVAAWRSGDWRALGWRALIDHGPRRYAILTWNAFWDSDER
ncbi:MAG: hypothetical protein OER88_08215, partial [Planctomycetota bacterium]|nr:hypothetical protein [Planctomycetota bacterium]